MSDEIRDAMAEFDLTGLYREESFTDRKVGTIRLLTPVTESGETDADRSLIFVGQTQVLTPAGTLPLNFEIPGDTLAEAAKNFSAAAQQAMEATAERLEKMRREAESSIIVPDKGAGPGAGGFGGLQGV
ncbi:uncharacterized protein METZ01_LOCUS140510 [marine metagenome]|uniref:Cytoplasmic protein n=1 Tax=marine metagenome TaxID=408172 RepID=A0A381ZEG0_9ZZZZ